MPYIYLVKCGEYFKIGIAADPAARLRGLQTGSAEPLELMRAVECVDARNAEAFLHHEFRKKKHRGEWFKLASEDILKFDRRCAVAQHNRIRIKLKKGWGASPKNDAARLVDGENPVGKPWIERFTNQTGNIYLRERQRVEKGGKVFKKIVRYIGRAK